jgi:APA family basic amino acid/polyamine antiporter
MCPSNGAVQRPPRCCTAGLLLQGLPVALCAAFSLSFTFAASWPLVALSLLGWLLATLSCYRLPIAYHPKSFQMPLFPLSPALGVLITVHLIGSLGWPAYVRFGVWMAAGMVIYCLYGIHAAEEKEALERSRWGEGSMQPGGC